MSIEAQTGTIESMVDYVLKHNIQPPKTYSLEVDFRDISDTKDAERAQIQFFNDIFQYAMNLKFNVENILDLSKEQFETLNLYMQSMGFKYIVHANDSHLDPWTIVQNENKIEHLNISIQLL